MAEVPEVNFHGRRIFIEVKPTDNAPALTDTVMKVLQDLMTNAKISAHFNMVQNAKLIKPN